MVSNKYVHSLDFKMYQYSFVLYLFINFVICFQRRFESDNSRCHCLFTNGFHKYLQKFKSYLGHKWREGKVDNCPPKFLQNRRRRRRAALLLAHPALDSYLRPCSFSLFRFDLSKKCNKKIAVFIKKIVSSSGEE